MNTVIVEAYHWQNPDFILAKHSTSDASGQLARSSVTSVAYTNRSGSRSVRTISSARSYVEPAPTRATISSSSFRASGPIDPAGRVPGPYSATISGG